MEEYKDFISYIEESIKEAKNFVKLESGDHVIITGGFKPHNTDKVAVNTNFMKIEII